jgi:hypothetical protein
VGSVGRHAERSKPIDSFSVGAGSLLTFDAVALQLSQSAETMLVIGINHLPTQREVLQNTCTTPSFHYAIESSKALSTASNNKDGK